MSKIICMSEFDLNFYFSIKKKKFVHRRNMRDLGRILQQRQMELRRLTAELHQTQTELLFTQVELDQVRRCLQRLDQRLLYAEDELDLARQGLLQASISK